MPLRIVEEAGLSDVGRQRTTNEDSYLESSPVFAVADGMGGARAGEVASSIAVQTFAENHLEDGKPEARLEEVARAANRRIYELAQEDESRSGMGTTLTAVIVADGDIATGHVGDSRLYRLRDGELERLTRDHSLVEELIRRGELAPEAADNHPQRSIITRALGPEPDVDVETFTCPGREGDVYLICSDGLTTMVSEDEVADILRRTDSLEEAARELVDVANRNGGKDNVTVVLFRLGQDDALGAGADTLSGQETRTGLSATAVKTAVKARERETETATRPDAGATAAPRRSAHPPTGRRRRARGLVAVAIVALAAAVLVAGFYIGSRQFYFVGTSEQGLITLYRGLPYDLPLGVSLYETEYSSAVPAATIRPPDRRAAILDHQLRGKGDAVDLMRQLEQGRLEP